MRDWQSALIIAATAAGLGLGGCAGTQLAAHAIKSAGDGEGDAPATGGAYKLGEPYVVDGTKYVPREDPHYDEVGVASWYGAEFHGRRTANGETYDMNALTAAHTTLPMPSPVRVTNLENGRSLVLTVNDRGPFVDGRIIDVSRRAAQLLGFDGKGTARVRVQALARPPADDEVQVAAAKVTALPADRGEAAAAVSARVHADVTMAPAPPPEPAAEEGCGGSFLIRSAAAAEPVPAASAYFVQGGAFRQQDNAVRLERRLAGFGPTRITAVEVDDHVLYRVRIGPVYAPEQAEALLSRVRDAGHAGARLVAEAR